MEILDIVSPEDEVIGQAPRKEIYEKALTHRIVHILVMNDEGQIALQRRSKHCSYCPLHWSMSAAGHVDAGESYEEAAARELKEELCIEGPLTFLRKEFYTEDPRKTDKFISAYLLRYNGDFDFNPREVDTVQWVSLTELEKMTLSGEPFHPQFPFMFDRVRNQLDI